MALADGLDGLLIDLDGVVWIGREMVPGAVQTLSELLANGKEIVFVTNNSVKRPAEYASRLRAAGIEVADDRVLTAGVVTAHLAAERVGRGGTAFVIGAPRFKEAVAAVGLELLDGDAARSADAVIVSAHREFDYAELLTATRALQGGAALFGTSRDPTLPMPGGAWPGTGATLAAVETASGRRAETGGKPEPHLFDQAKALIPAAERVAIVGDRIASDIEGGRRAGLMTVLVLTGASTRTDAEAATPPPDHVVDDLPALLR
ncbi:MAG TPA: HAD-IIA family hydrolase [Solirubrobacterales bacterium]|nr:HAD-IIA family hydrolase [Solirubrobacterales bacterium]